MAKRNALKLCLFNLFFVCLCLEVLSYTESGKENTLSTWSDADGSLEESHTTEDSLQDFRDLLDLLKRITFRPSEEENTLSTWSDADGSWEEYHTTEDSLKDFRDLLERFKRITFSPYPEVKIPDINDRKIYDRKKYDYFQKKKEDKSIYLYLIIAFTFALLGMVVYAVHYFCKEERATTLGDQPPLYDEVVLHLPRKSDEFPQVKPSELETPPPQYNDATMNRY